MSKRTPGLPQRPRGFWPTPREAVVPLIPYLPQRAKYGEPCAGVDNCAWYRLDAQNRHPAMVRGA